MEKEKKQKKKRKKKRKEKKTINSKCQIIDCSKLKSLLGWGNIFPAALK